MNEMNGPNQTPREELQLLADEALKANRNNAIALKIRDDIPGMTDAQLWKGIELLRKELGTALPPASPVSQELARLINVLSDRREDWDRRRAAAWALGEIKDPSAVEPLLQVLGKRGLSESAASALISIGPAAVPALITALKDEYSQLQGSSRARLLTKVFQGIGEPAVPALRDALSVENEDIRQGAMTELREIGAVAVPVIIEALKNEHSDVRRAAAEALGAIKDTRAVEPLIEAFGDRNNRVDERAAEALVWIGAPAVEPLIAALRTENYSVRNRAANALSEINDTRVVPALCEALRDDSWAVHDPVVRVLGSMADSQVVPVLLDTLQNDDWDRRNQVAEVLGNRKEPRASSALYTGLVEGTLDRRVASCALGQIKDPSSVEPLIAALKNENYEVRYEAANALGGIKDLRAVPALIAALKDSYPDVREAAACALGDMGPDAKACVPALCQRLTDGRDAAAARALGRIKDREAVQALITVLNYEERDIRRDAAWALGEIGDKKAITLLREQLMQESDNYIRRTIDRAIQKLEQN